MPSPIIASEPNIGASDARRRTAPEPAGGSLRGLSNSFDLPLEGAAIAEFIGKLEEAMLRHGYEPIISLTLINDRYAKCFQQLMYDREIAGEDEKAGACHAELFALIEESGFTAFAPGYHPYGRDAAPGALHHAARPDRARARSERDPGPRAL